LSDAIKLHPPSGKDPNAVNQWRIDMIILDIASAQRFALQKLYNFASLYAHENSITEINQGFIQIKKH
jgi:hypothetical protein